MNKKLILAEITLGKKLIIAATALAVSTSLSINGTLMLFQDTKIASNVITIGDLKIDFLESDDGLSYKTIGENNFVGLNYLTGVNGTITKMPKVQLVGNSSDAYIRIKYTAKFVQDRTDKNVPSSFTPPTAASGWFYVGNQTTGYYYYGTKTENDAPHQLTKLTTNNNDSNPAFESVIIPDWASDISEKLVITIELQAQAIQADNNTGRTITEVFSEFGQ